MVGGGWWVEGGVWVLVGATNHQPPSPPSPDQQPLLLVRGAETSQRLRAMGSLGWAQCYWCWRWEYDMYIPDWVGRPLCVRCGDRDDEGERPPWQPDARARLQLVLEKMLPGRAAELVADFARPYWQV